MDYGQVATLIAVYANISFAEIRGIGWGWAGVIWLFSLIFYVPLDIIKFTVHYALSGEAWSLLFDRKVSKESLQFRLIMLSQLDKPLLVIDLCISTDCFYI